MGEGGGERELSTTDSCDYQPGYVEAFLPRGERNAVSTLQLVALTGYHSARELQKQIEIERGRGALILSRSGNGGGYFMPSAGEAGKREIAVYVRTLRARALNTLRTLKTARAALAQIDGQESLNSEIMDGVGELQ